MLLSLAIFAFVCQSELVQLIQVNGGFNKPFFILYVEHSAFSVFITFVYFYRKLWLKTKGNEIFRAEQALINELPLVWKNTFMQNFHCKIIFVTIAFSSATICWYISVSKIALGEITAIYNTNAFFTYLLSILFLNEKLLWIKLFAVLISFVGVILITFGGNDESDSAQEISESAIGYASALISSVCTAGYEILYGKTMVPATPRTAFSLYVTGWMGVYSMLLGLPVFPILHYFAWERFELPTASVLLYISINAVIGIIYNSVFFLLISHTSPVYAAVGILLSIPLTSLVDRILNDTILGWNLVIGTFMICAGFYFLQVKGPKYNHIEELPPF